MTLPSSEMDLKLHRVADVLWTTWSNGEPTSPVRELMDGVVDLHLAYAIQEINCIRSLKEGRKIVGRKIGLTSFAMQKKMGVDEPNYGTLFADTERSENQSVPFSTVVQPKIEAEIAFVMGRSVMNPAITEAEFTQCVDHACASFEIVNSRTKEWDNTLFDTISDNVSASMFVLGNEKHSLDELDLVHCKMVMTCNGILVSEGQGSNCYGSPLLAGAWLARRLVKVGRPLQEGEVILTGALGPIVPVEPNTSFIATIEGLGSVTASFS